MGGSEIFKLTYSSWLSIEKLLVLTSRFVLSFCLLIPNFVQSEDVDRSKIETAFIYQFTNYISWPQSAKAEEFRITIVGESPLYEELKILAQEKLINGKKIQILRVNTPSEVTRSQIIFLANNDVAQLKELALASKNSGTLIISRFKDFAKKGAMINFYLENERLRFEVNRKRLLSEQLETSSRLLQLARVVE